MKILLISFALLLLSTSAMRAKQNSECSTRTYHFTSGGVQCSNEVRTCPHGTEEGMDCPGRFFQTR